ncbi:hypothetical protein [Pedobacter antarcticus]|uniref:hypothetical protein n=1 Tax=Pedobacter antarcticus TaxID=34086 RepID=UPI00292F4BF3|nr:hypothetical protein [Pedobacter antarcticus]
MMKSKRKKDRPKLEDRNKIIYKEFERLFNVKGLRVDVIYGQLAGKFYLSEQSIQKIVLKQAKGMPVTQDLKLENSANQ